MNVALTALEATVHIQGAKGERDVAIGDFFLVPGSTPQRETVLEPGDLITFVTLPAPRAGSKQVYLKLRDRASYEFALSSAAIVAVVNGGKLDFVRVALGGVGTKPWRSLEAERVLHGKTGRRKDIPPGGRSGSARRTTAKRKRLQDSTGQALHHPRSHACNRVNRRQIPWRRYSIFLPERMPACPASMARSKSAAPPCIRRTTICPACSTRSRYAPPSPAAPSPRSIAAAPRRCPESRPSIPARTWASSLELLRLRTLPGFSTSAVLRSRTTPSATTDNTSPPWWHYFRTGGRRGQCSQGHLSQRKA